MLSVFYLAIWLQLTVNTLTSLLTYMYTSIDVVNCV